MGEQRNQKVNEEDALKEAEATLKQIENAGGDTGKDGKESDKKTSKPVKEGKAKQRSEKYKKVKDLVDRNKLYSLDDALELVKKTSYSKFDGSVEIHIKLDKVKKGETIRGLIQLPHKAGKTLKVGIIDETLIAKILENKKTEFDILIASPEMMPKIGRLAKILGPQGKMPNPKSETVTKEPEKAMKEIQEGRVEFKADDQGIIHMAVGKVSWDINKLTENFKAIMLAVGNRKAQSIVLSATMGPGVKVGL